MQDFWKQNANKRNATFPVYFCSKSSKKSESDIVVMILYIVTAHEKVCLLLLIPHFSFSRKEKPQNLGEVKKLFFLRLLTYKLSLRRKWLLDRHYLESFMKRRKGKRKRRLPQQKKKNIILT